MQKKENCFNCAYIQSALSLTPIGLVCGNQVDRWFAKGIPDSEICERYLPQSGKTIKEALGQDVAGLRLILKERKWPEEYIEEFLSQDYTLISAGIEK